MDNYQIDDILNTDQELYNQDIELDGISFNNEPDLDNDISNIENDISNIENELEEDLMIKYKKYKDMSIKELKEIIYQINNHENKKISISGNKTKLIKRIIENTN